MAATVGIAEFRRNLSSCLRRAANGERLIVTNRDRPVAELRPPTPVADGLDRLIVECRGSDPSRRRRPPRLVVGTHRDALSRALDEVRGDSKA